MYNRSHTGAQNENVQRHESRRKNRRFTRIYEPAQPSRSFAPRLFAVVLLAALPLAAQDQKNSNAQQSSSDNDSIGFNLGKNASAKDVGLPIYPGARRHIDDANDSSALNMGLWGGSAGFKLFVLKMESQRRAGEGRRLLSQSAGQVRDGARLQQRL